MVAEGQFFDFRHITMTLAGFIGGPVTAVIAVFISSLYRYYLGGSGIMGGIIIFIIFAFFGSILHKHFRSKQNGKKPLFWFMIGIVMACLVVFFMTFISPLINKTIPAFGTVSVLYLIITPFATTIIFNFYFWAHEFFTKALILDTIIKDSPINLLIFDTHGPILSSKTLKTELKAYPFIETFFPLLCTDESSLNVTESQRRDIPTEDGRHFVANLTNFHLLSGEYACLAIVNDITEQKLVQDKLIKSQKEMASILGNMTDGFVAIDENWIITNVNRAGEIILGKSRDEILGKILTEVFKCNEVARLHYHEVMSEKRSVTFEILAKVIGNKWFEVSAFPIENGIAVYFRDITSRKIAEEALRQSEDKFSKVFHGGPIMMTLATVEEGKFIDANEALCSGTGYTHEEIIGRTTKELNFFVDTGRRQKMLMEQGKLENEELGFRTKSGEIRCGLSWSQLIYFDGQPCHITGLIDITEEKRLQQEMARIDRLNLVGQLAAGIAHEIRNPMTTVRGYLQLLGTKPEYEAKKSTFDLMISELDRANAIITEFLSLAQTKQMELKSENLNNLLNNLYPLIEADTFTQNKQIRIISGEIPDLELNAKEICQLVLNLTRNGLEAMEENGSLTIRSYVEDSKVVLEISDEGCGIPQEHISKIGTPFFTTKDTGTGLGLALCYKIAESHNAKVRVDSSSSGTTFFILFPISDKEQEKIA